MNPDTNRLEMLKLAVNEGQGRERAFADIQAALSPTLVRPDGSPVPPHWPVFTAGELVEVKGYTFRIAHCGEAYMVLEPVGPLVVPAAKAVP